MTGVPDHRTTTATPVRQESGHEESSIPFPPRPPPDPFLLPATRKIVDCRGTPFLRSGGRV